MEDLELEGRRIQKHTAYEIEDEYENLLMEYRRKYMYRITDIIQQQIRGIPDYRIEEWVEEYLISEIRSSGRRQNNRIVSDLEDNFETLINNSTQNLDMHYSRYTENLNEIIRSSRKNSLEDISLDFINIASRRIEQYYDCFYGLVDRNFERALENIKYELRPIIKRLNEQFQEEYQTMIRVTLKNNQNKMDNWIIEAKEKDEPIPEEYIAQAAKMLEYNDFELLREENKLYARDKKTKKVHELKYDKQYKQFNTESSIGMQIIDGSMVSVNIDEDLLLVDNQISLEISDVPRMDIIKVSQGLDGYDFYFNNQKITDKEEIVKLIQAIQKKCPGYYNKQLQDPEFAQLIPEQLQEIVDEKENPYVFNEEILPGKTLGEKISYLKESRTQQKRR